MIRETLDNKNFRIIFAILIGAPETVAYLLLLMYGFVFTLAAVQDPNPVLIAFVTATFLGTLGIIGAWLRIIVTSENQTETLQKFTRISLACGIGSSLILLVLAGLGELVSYLGPPLLALTIVGVVFYVGT